MNRHLFALLLLLLPLTSAVAQSSSAVADPAAAPAHYGIAYVLGSLSGSCKLVLLDGVTPNPKLKRYEEGGRDKEFADEAAVLNFLAAQGWDVTPYGNETNRYILKRHAR